jgi:hypothetical protein
MEEGGSRYGRTRGDVRFRINLGYSAERCCSSSSGKGLAAMISWPHEAKKLIDHLS